MPSFSADYPEIARTLAASLGEPSPPDPPDPPPDGFRAVLLAFLDEPDGGPIIAALDGDGFAIDPEALAEADPAELADLLRRGRSAAPKGVGPSLQRLARWVVDRGGVEALAEVGTDALRDELRAIRGVGAATADRILLRALGRAAFPVGRSDYRILVRHGWVDESAGYDDARDVISGAIPDDPEAIARLSRWFAIAAKDCRVAAPRCDRCPMRPFLPEGGPIEPSSAI